MTEDRGKGALALGGLGVLYLVLMLAGLRLFRFLGSRDLETVRRVLPGPLQPLASLPGVDFLFGGRA